MDSRSNDVSELVPSTRRIFCRWCRRSIVQPSRGRPREFCKRSCRQRDFESRSKAAAHGLDERQLIVTRKQLDDLRDRLYVLVCAVQDVDADLGATQAGAAGWPKATPLELRDSLMGLLAAARPLVEADGLGSGLTS
jgi:hypothetical protein